MPGYIDMMRRYWPNPGGDPIRADQVEDTKKKFRYYVERFLEATDSYLKSINDPKRFAYYRSRVQGTRLQGTLKFLYDTCSVSKEIIDNMIHVINNPDLYKDELQQTINDMASTWAGYYKNNADVKKTLRQTLKDNA
ncbi:hypothetical protein M9Y10_004676, partial [Tritrichomonas musculus]